MNRFGRSGTVLLTLGGLLAACGGTALTDPADYQVPGGQAGTNVVAGHGGDAGYGGQVGRGGAFGEPGGSHFGPGGATGFAGAAAGSGVGNQQYPEACFPQPLSRACGSSCPKSAAQVTFGCSGHDGAIRYRNDCGGYNVHGTSGLAQWTYYFDAKGLIGTEVSGDAAFACPNGQARYGTSYGSTCEAIGPEENLCDLPGSAGAAGAP